MSNLGGMTDGQAIAIFGAGALALGAYLADVYTTMIGMQNGFKEVGFVSKNLFKLVARFKWLNLQCIQCLLGGAMLCTGAAFSNYGWDKSVVWFGIVGGGEAVVAFRNYRRLKAAKISLK